MNKRNTQYIIDTYNKHGKVMEAFLAGETVQIYDECTKIWNDFEVIEPSWLLANKYRVKPKSRYRPFNSFDEAKHLLNQQVVSTSNCTYCITGIADEGVYVNHVYKCFQILAECYNYYGTKNPVGVICEN